MIAVYDLLNALRPMHLGVAPSGHVRQVGATIRKLAGASCPTGRPLLEMFEIVRPSGLTDFAALRSLAGRVIRLRLRSGPKMTFRAVVVDDREGGIILDLSFGIFIVEAVQNFDLTAQDFAPTDLAVELLFLHEAKSAAMAASSNLNHRLDGARHDAERRAMTDVLTGLKNRRALDGALARLGQTKQAYALLHVDLDRFKQVNDTLGHTTGDAVLHRVATIMQAETRQDDVLARTGGDEFVILCPGLSDQTRLTGLATTLIAEISEPTRIEGHVTSVSASIGISVQEATSTIDPTHAMERADIALYAAKRAGRGRFQFWEPSMGRRLTDLGEP